MLLTTSPMPARPCRVRPGSHEVQVDDDRERDVHAVRALAAVVVAGELTGEAMPSLARLVATDTIGMPEPGGGVLGGVDGLAAADADHRVVRAGRAASRRRSRAASSVPPRHGEDVGRVASDGRISSAIRSPWPGPTTTATSPPAEMRRSASDRPRSATAPRRTSMCSGRVQRAG